MNNQYLFTLLLNSTEYQIPTEFPFLFNVNPDILKHLRSYGKYQIKTNANDNLFTSFLYFWVYGKYSTINFDDYSSLYYLCQEFDMMMIFYQLICFSAPNISFVTSNKLIKEVTISPNAVLINVKAFANCENIEKVSIPKNSQLRIIGDESFKKCNLTSICIPASVLIIGSSAFSDCSNLNKIEFCENSQLTIIGYKAFERSGLVEILIPPHVKVIEKEAFNFCKCLEKVEFSENSEIEKICEYAFYGSSIKSLTIPSSVEYVGDGWIYSTPNLTNIIVIPNKKQNISITNDSIILGKTDLNKNEFDIIFLASRDIKTVEIPASIVQISEAAFGDCKLLEKVTFSNDSKLQVIKKYAFLNTNLTSICIPSNVIQICNCAFYDSSQLSEVTFSMNPKLKYIGQRVFTCTDLKKIQLPSTIEYLEEGWLCNTPYLTDISVIPSENPFFTYYNDSLLIGKSDPDEEIFDTIYLIRKNILSITVPSFIKYISSYSFSESNIEKVDFSKDSQLLIIEKLAFAYSQLNRLKIPKKVSVICEFAFSDSSIKSIEFEDDSDLEIIGKNAFTSSQLRCISLPQRLAIIENECFSDCKELQIIEIAEDSELDVIKKAIFDDSTPLIMIPVNFKGTIEIGEEEEEEEFEDEQEEDKVEDNME